MKPNPLSRANWLRCLLPFVSFHWLSKRIIDCGDVPSRLRRHRRPAFVGSLDRLPRARMVPEDCKLYHPY